MSTSQPTWPGETLFAVTPSDSTVFAEPVRQLYIGTAGNVAVQTQDGVVVTFSNVNAGSYLGPFWITKVRATNTTASNIVAFV